MIFVRDSDKPVAKAAADLEEAVKAGGFGVLHSYDLQAILESKGFELPQQCRIFEVCNPAQASKVLAADMALNMALPCRISVYEDAGKTKIGMIRPTSLLASMSDDESLRKTAEAVEVALEKMIETAA